MSVYHKTNFRIDIELVKDLIEEYQGEFECPFSNEHSYLHIYKNDPCAVAFLTLQACDYFADANKEGEVYIKYLMKTMKSAGRTDDYEFLRKNYEMFTIETNESNFHIPLRGLTLLRHLTELFGYVYRARIVKLPAGGEMPLHRDETAHDFIRYVVPIYTNEKCVSLFREGKTLHREYWPADGFAYYFDDAKIEHGVQNNSKKDRYALIFNAARDETNN